MPILDKNNKNQIARYENFIKESENTSFMQDISWSKIKDNWKSEIVYLEENNEIYAAMQVLIHPLPKTKYTMLYVPRGPVCDFNKVDIVNNIIEETKQIAKKYNAFILKLEPNVCYSRELYETYKKIGYKIAKENSILKNTIQPRYNMIVDVKEKTELDVLNSFSSKTRYNIRYSYKNKIEVYYSNSIEDLHTFYQLYEITAKRDKFDKRSYAYFEKLLKSYQNNQIRIYIAKLENEPLSAGIAINYSKEVYYLYGASANDKRNLKATYALQFEMIKWAIYSNCHTYNLGGLLKLDKSNGLYQFKIGFCREKGIKQYIGDINKVYNKTIYYAYKIALPILQVKNNIINGTINK